MWRILSSAILCLLELLIAPLLCALALAARLRRKPFDVGLGPLPLIGHLSTQQALQERGYRCETFVYGTYHVTSRFDYRADRLPGRGLLGTRLHRYLGHLWLSVRSLLRYRCHYLYFNGGPLGLGGRRLLRALEPHLYRLAGARTVVMAYGTDVQEMSRSPSLLFKHTQSLDYRARRGQRRRVAADIDRWTLMADHVVAGCDWVDYLYHWDTLMLSHFSVDVERWKPSAPESGPQRETLRILHAPNHRQVKGTRYFVEAVEALAAAGTAVELVLLEKVDNERIREAMATVDVVADQLVLGWYAMFAVEAMAMARPVLCYLRPDLEQFYVETGLVEPGEIPIVNCTPLTVKEAIAGLASDRSRRKEIGRRSREFVLRHHSIEAVAGTLDRINRGLGIEPGAGSGPR